MIKKGFAVAAFAGVMLLGSVANAEAVFTSVTGPVNSALGQSWTVNTDDSKAWATVQAAAGSLGFLVAADIGNANPVGEVALLNGVIAPDVDPAGYNQTTFPKVDSNTFDVTGQYFMLKFGSVVSVWFENLKPLELVTVYVNTGTQMGLSHVTSAVTPVPGPGALALLGIGLAGLGAARRRKKA